MEDDGEESFGRPPLEGRVGEGWGGLGNWLVKWIEYGWMADRSDRWKIIGELDGF